MITLSEKKAKEIIRYCDQMEAFAKTIQNYSAIVKAEMNACLGGVGTAPDRINKKVQKEAAIRARFHKK